MKPENSFVTYEAFGATGDGVADDLPAIFEAHAYANAHGLNVRTKPEATYHLGARALTAVIATDTDWTTSRFTIDDTRVDDHKQPLFEVRSLLEPENLQIDRLARDQKQMDLRPAHDCHILVENANRKLYIRRGLNANDGVPQQDCFILRRDGSVDGDIDWNYDTITRVAVRPIDGKRLILRGGVFTTFANRMSRDEVYNYWSRNIVITRPNTEIDGLTHYVAGETAEGQPYGGFLYVRQCADITIRNCFFSGHKVYRTVGAGGKPVPMGSYDVSVNSVVNFHMQHCRMNHILDRTRWGVITSNFCKNILLEDCTLSRMDTHMGVSGTYTIRRCQLGHMGLNAIGRGLLTVEDSTLYKHALICFRSDYGSTWEGDIIIRNSQWIPACGDMIWPCMFDVCNDGRHDFGYACFMPREITIDGLFVDDSNHPEDYEGLYFFPDPNRIEGGENGTPPAMERPFPFTPCRRISVRGLTTASGRKPRVSPNDELAQGIVIEAYEA